jgi:signal transduction histidine kinase
MSNKNIITSEGTKQFGQAMEQLKLSLEELQIITENMIPEKLFSVDFKDYYKGICNDFGTENSIHIYVRFTGNFEKIDDAPKVKIYRVIHTLLNFLVNHTKPTQIDLSFIRSEKSITIHVSDNGRKYNMPVLDYPGIKEVEQIRTLTESMNGVFNFLQARKKGNQAGVVITI